MSFRLLSIRRQHIEPELQDHYMLDGMAEGSRSNIVQQSHRIGDPFNGCCYLLNEIEARFICPAIRTAVYLRHCTHSFLDLKSMISYY